MQALVVVSFYSVEGWRGLTRGRESVVMKRKPLLQVFRWLEYGFGLERESSKSLNSVRPWDYPVLAFDSWGCDELR